MAASVNKVILIGKGSVDRLEYGFFLPQQRHARSEAHIWMKQLLAETAMSLH